MWWGGDREVGEDEWWVGELDGELVRRPFVEEEL